MLMTSYTFILNLIQIFLTVYIVCRSCIMNEAIFFHGLKQKESFPELHLSKT